MFQEMIDLKVQCQGMTEQRGLRLKRKVKDFCPYKRIASCNEDLGDGDDEEEYLAEPYLRTLPAPEDQQLLAHMEPFRETEATGVAKNRNHWTIHDYSIKYYMAFEFHANFCL